MLKKEHLETLEAWAQSKGYLVYIETDGDDTVDLENKIIMIKSTASIEAKIMTLSHECGHVLLHENDSFEIRKISTSGGKKTKLSKVFTVIEEIEAWKRGLTLCRRLGIPIERVKWERAVANAIDKYMRWATE